MKKIFHYSFFTSFRKVNLEEFLFYQAVIMASNSMKERDLETTKAETLNVAGR